MSENTQWTTGITFYSTSALKIAQDVMWFDAQRCVRAGKIEQLAVNNIHVHVVDQNDQRSVINVRDIVSVKR